MTTQTRWQRFRGSEEWSFLRRLLLLIIAAPFIWGAVRFSMWLTMPDRLLVNKIILYSGDPESLEFWEMEQLLAWGADPNYVYAGEPNIVRVASRPYVEVAKLLLRHDADRYARDSKGATALDTACYYDQREMVVYLKSVDVPFTGIFQTTFDQRPLPPACDG